LTLFVTLPQKPDLRMGMFQPEIKPDGCQVTLGPLIDREYSPALGMHPARQMKARSDRRVIQPTIKELLESRQRGIATGLMPFAATSEAAFKFLR
jgi:hypothetical protein